MLDECSITELLSSQYLLNQIPGDSAYHSLRCVGLEFLTIQTEASNSNVLGGQVGDLTKPC